MRETSLMVSLAAHVAAAALAFFPASDSAAADTITNVTSFEYDPSTGVLTATVQNPGDPKLNLRTTYTYDGWGNRLTTVVSSSATGDVAIPTRTAQQIAYDINYGVSPKLFTNALGQQTNAQFDPSNFPLYLQALNGLVSQWAYDGFGRVTKEIRPDENYSTWKYVDCSASSPCSIASAVFVVTKTQYSPTAEINGPIVKIYYDLRNRVVRTETTGFDGVSTIIVDTEYDSLGRVYRTSRPYYAGQTIYWTVYSYDVLGRVVDVTGPDASVVHTDYNGLTTTVTNPLRQQRSTSVDSRGLPLLVTDDSGNTLRYEYDAAGRLLKTTDPAGNVVAMSYDLAGNKVSLTDPDLGTIRYVYDALGQMRQQTDAKGQTVTFQYDLLGRVTSRAEPDLVSTWTYDSCTMGKGRVCVSTADNGYKSTTTYDDMGRPATISTTIDTQYVTNITYDADGRIATRQFPSGLQVRYFYNSIGNLLEIRNANTNQRYWQANRMDAEDHLLQQTYGNNVVTQQDFDPATGRITGIKAGANNSVQNLAFTYDKRGNLLTRSDANQTLSESFQYDNLNRLTANTVNSSSAGLVTQTYSYDSIGNITNRSDSGSYTYGAVNAKPHAVAQILRANGGRREFSYDASGNLVAEVERDATNNVIATAGRTATWTSFNMPLSLNNSGTSAQFVYGTEHQRIKEINPGYTTYYLHPDNAGGLFYEKDVKGDGTTEHRHFIEAGSAGVVAIVKKASPTSAQTVIYLHHDYLGSTTAVTDAAGSTIERMAYEPFGKRRTPAGALDQNGTLIGVNTNRGYTNHEALDSLGLVHMNGRVYDPATGRFISADPYVPKPGDLQAYNRYAYVRNNPMMFIDPTGFSDKDIDEEVEEDQEYSTGPSRRDGGYSASDVARAIGGSVGNADGQDIARINITASKLSDWAHDGLFAASFLPSIYGSAFSAMDAFLYDYEGKKEDANLAYTAAFIGVVSDAGIAKVTIKAAYALPKFAASLEKQLAKDGAKSIFNSLDKFERRLAEHVEKVDSLRYKSAVEREIRTFEKSIETLKQFIKENGLKR